MSAPAIISDLLASLTQSLASAQEVADKATSLQHQQDGISLLDVKNELLLSYLQNLVFLILLKLRNFKSETGPRETGELDEAVRAKLVELRLFLEKGARPLEEKLRFSIDQFLRTAQDAQRDQDAASRKIRGGKKATTGSESSDSGSDSDDSSSESSDSEAGDLGGRKGSKKVAAPNLNAMVDQTADRPSRDDDTGAPSGIYRPPRRERQLMEADAAARARKKTDRRPGRSTTMDEFITSELSSAPMAEPSVGTTIVQGGRKMKTAADRREEDERREYEEMNFVRLPKESKKEKAKRSKAEGRNSRMTFGGEEFRDLGEGVDRIDRLTRRKEGGPRGGGVRAMLDKSRKRGADTVDGPRGSGMQMGERYQKRVKTLEAGRRDRGKGR